MKIRFFECRLSRPNHWLFLTFTGKLRSSVITNIKTHRPVSIERLLPDVLVV